MIKKSSLTIYYAIPGHKIGEEINGFVILKLYEPRQLQTIELQMIGRTQTYYEEK